MSTAWRISALILLSSLSRLDGKGCFLETSKVTTADLEHSQKPLAAVTEGEKAEGSSQVRSPHHKLCG